MRVKFQCYLGIILSTNSIDTVFTKFLDLNRSSAFKLVLSTRFKVHTHTIIFITVKSPVLHYKKKVLKTLQLKIKILFYSFQQDQWSNRRKILAVSTQLKQLRKASLTVKKNSGLNWIRTHGFEPMGFEPPNR